MIELKNVSCQFGNKIAVDRISLTIKSGEICVLVGSSGCGKSTTLKMINRLLPRSAGEILVDDQDVDSFNVRQLRLNMGYAIQGTGLFPHWSVARNIGLVPKLLGWKKVRIQQRVDELLTLLGMKVEEFAGKYPHQLSGGQAQRVGVARALAADPNILLMDEPFGALDAITRESLQKEILKIQHQVRRTMVFVTHDIDEAMKLADRIAVMDAGRIVQHDTPENILRQPASEFVENLFGSRERGLKMAALKRVADVMRHLAVPCEPDMDVVGIKETDSLRQALSLILWQNTDQLPVLGEFGKQTGVLTLDQLRKETAG